LGGLAREIGSSNPSAKTEGKGRLTAGRRLLKRTERGFQKQKKHASMEVKED